MSRCCLDIWIFTDKCLVIYPIWTKYMFSLSTLDGSASILQPRSSMDFLHSVLFAVKIGSAFFLFSATRLAVIKIYPTVIESSHKRYEVLPSLYPSILYHHILPLSRLKKNSESALQTLWHPGYGEKHICGPLLTWPTQVSNLFGVGRGPQIYKNWTSYGGDNWGWCCKKWQEHSFVRDNTCEAISENRSDWLEYSDYTYYIKKFILKKKSKNLIRERLELENTYVWELMHILKTKSKTNPK